MKKTIKKLPSINNINKKNINYNYMIFLLMLFSFMFISVNAEALEIQNKATAKYKDRISDSLNSESNVTITRVIDTSANALDVLLTPVINSIEGQKRGTWIFPIVVRNIGRDDDSYNLTIGDIPPGVSYNIYKDVNGNGVVDPEDSIITVTPILASGEPYNIIAVLTDNLGLVTDPQVRVTPLAVSTTDSSVDSFDYLYVNFRSPGNGGGGGGGKPTPTPTPTLTCPDGFKAKSTVCVPDGEKIKTELRKSVYPSGKVKLGDILTYTLELENKGSMTVNDVEIFDSLPSAVTLVADSNNLPFAVDGGKIEYSVNSSAWVEEISNTARIIRASWEEILPGSKLYLTFKVKVSSSFKEGEIVNIAYSKLETKNKSKEVLIEPIRSNETVNTVKNDFAIIGTVIDKETGLPKENAVVDAYDKDGNKVGTEITGKSGKFRIPVDAAGEYKLVYADQNGVVITERKATVTVPGDNPAPIEISGKVLNSQTNEAIPNAQLALLDKDGKTIVTINTDENGRYVFGLDNIGKDLAAGSYTVRVTKANGQVSYVKATVSVSPGDIILNLDLLIDPFGFVYDLLGGKDVRIQGAKVELIDGCGKDAPLVKLDDLEKGVSQKNPQITEVNGNYQYFLNKEQLTNRTYCLRVTADSYEDRLLLVRVYPSQKVAGRYEITVMDEKGKKLIISNIETIPYEIGMKPLKVLDLKKNVNKSTIDLGEIATYTVEVANKLKFRLTDVKLEDTLPVGFKYVEGTLRINGKKVEDFKAITKLDIKIGDLAPQEKVVLTYQTRSGIRVAEGASINTVVATAKTPSGESIPPEQATATVFVKKGVFSKNGTIIGKVYIDSNNNGIHDGNDKFTENIVIYTSNGVRVITDSKGKFSIPDIQNGQMVLKVDSKSLPKGVYLPVQALKLQKESEQKIASIQDKEVDLNNFNKKVFVVVKDKEITLSNSSNYNMVLEAKDKSLIEVKSSILKVADLNLNEVVNNSKTISVNDLKLDKGFNELNVLFVDKDNKTVKTKKAYFFLMEDISKIQFPRWIGDEGESSIVYIPESGLAKANFRLVKADLELPEIPSLPKQKESNMKAVYVYPDKFAAKQIPYITYPDIKSHWSREIVEYESGLEIIHGYPDGLFKPARDITRAETTKLALVAIKSFDIKLGTTLGVMLKDKANLTARILNDKREEVIKFFEKKDKEAGVNKVFWDGKDSKGNFIPRGKYYFEVTAHDGDDETTLETNIEVLDAIPNYRPKGRSKFSDVPAWHWSDSFIKAGVDESLITGYPDGTFRPDSTIPRYEMAAVGVKALGLDLGLAKDELPFKDADQVPSWARKYVYLAYTYGLLPKFPDNKFYPNRPISRSEIALFVLELINKQKIDARVRGSVTEDVNKLIIDGNTVKTENNVFEFYLNKELYKDIDLSFEEAQSLNSYFDSLYLPKQIKRPTTKF